MLIFYLINDDHVKPNTPQEKKHVGGLDDQTFENLKRKGIIDTRFDYYSDFRWGTAIIKQILEKISQKQIQSDNDVKELLKLLNIAEKEQSGLIAYCD
jgi:hypothetical protein